MQNLSPFDWSICLGYLLLVFALGLWFAGQQQTKRGHTSKSKDTERIPTIVYTSTTHMTPPATGVYC